MIKGSSKPGYSWLTDTLRNITTEPVQCSLGCMGAKCKYCTPIGRFPKEDFCIDGLYCNWVTDKILAMARPFSHIMEKHRTIYSMIKNGIKSVFNLQLIGEHAKCGEQPLGPSGFSYEPSEFMDAGIFYYNFGFTDYGAPSLGCLLDIVKVLDFALSQGKVAIHCHAGRGRTGLLIACWLIYNRRWTSDHTINYIRLKRAGAVQTKTQVNCVRRFESIMRGLWVVYPRSDYFDGFSLSQYLSKQKLLYHGDLLVQYRSAPRIVIVICNRLLQIAKDDPLEFESYDNDSIMMDEDEDKEIMIECIDETSKQKLSKSLPDLFDKLMIHDVNSAYTSCDNLNFVSNAPDFYESINVNKSKSIDCIKEEEEEDSSNNPVYEALVSSSPVDSEFISNVRTIEFDLNTQSKGWNLLHKENNPKILVTLLWHWISKLNEPILNNEVLEAISGLSCRADLTELKSAIPASVFFTLVCFLDLVIGLQPLSKAATKLLISRIYIMLSSSKVEDDEFINRVYFWVNSNKTLQFSHRRSNSIQSISNWQLQR